MTDEDIARPHTPARAPGSGKVKQGLSLREAADRLGMARQTLSGWEEKGCVVRLADRSIDLEATAALIDQNRNPAKALPAKAAAYSEKVSSNCGKNHTSTKPDAGAKKRGSARTPPPDPVDPTFGQALPPSGRPRREALAALREELTVRQLVGELIPVAEAVRFYVDKVTLARAALEAIPSRVASDLVGLDAQAIKAVLTKEVHNVLSELSNDDPTTDDDAPGPGPATDDNPV